MINKHGKVMSTGREVDWTVGGIDCSLTNDIMTAVDFVYCVVYCN